MVGVVAYQNISFFNNWPKLLELGFQKTAVRIGFGIINAHDRNREGGRVINTNIGKKIASLDIKDDLVHKMFDSTRITN